MFSEPYRVPPPDLCYAVVVKKRGRGRVVEVSTRIVYGTTQQIEAALQASPVSHVITTYGVERNYQWATRRLRFVQNARTTDKFHIVVILNTLHTLWDSTWEPVT